MTINLETISVWWFKGQFRIKERFQFYNMLILLLDNGKQQFEALGEMYDVFSDGGRKKRNIIAMVCEDATIGMREGRRLSDVLEKWVSYDEFSLIQAGEEAGRLQDAFRRAMKLVDNKKRVMGAVMTATIYPGFLAAQGVYLMTKVADIVPKLERTSDPSTWGVEATSLRDFAYFIIDHGATTLALVVLALAAILLSMPYLNGRVRFYLDRIPPWNIYRTLYGSTFLQNVGVMLNSGRQLPDVLLLMRRSASPWLRRRIDDTLHGVTLGASLGVALHRAGHEFPDKMAVKLLQVISGHRDSEKAIEDFGTKWAEDTVDRLEKMGKAFLVAFILFNGFILLWVLAGTNSMTNFK